MITYDEMMKSGKPLPQLIAMIGLPRSGKSTFCQHYLKPLGYVIVNPDSFRLALHGQPFVKSAEPFVWASVTLAVDALLSLNHSVVIDATNITMDARAPWIKRNAEFIWINTPVTMCIERAGDNLELIEVIKRMDIVGEYRGV